MAGAYFTREQRDTLRHRSDGQGKAIAEATRVEVLALLREIRQQDRKSVV